MSCVIRHKWTLNDRGVIYTFADGRKLIGDVYVCDDCNTVRTEATGIEAPEPPIPDAVARHNARRLS